MTTYDHIQQLRAELAVSTDAAERRQLQPSLQQQNSSTQRKRLHSTR
ncbi:hypothetical protein JNB91_28365 [Rhizobium wenxiniae]|nr:hypothetical protein [Rhizobium wenxiniae]MBW9091710.1 hypothetical protein [Rhizobium wenxiniae]